MSLVLTTNCSFSGNPFAYVTENYIAIFAIIHNGSPSGMTLILALGRGKRVEVIEPCRGGR
jgi:hypothetical protein